jgi:hypothetical protein
MLICTHFAYDAPRLSTRALKAGDTLRVNTRAQCRRARR